MYASWGGDCLPPPFQAPPLPLLQPPPPEPPPAGPSP